MSTIDNYGIQYGTGELFPKENPGGTTDPNAVTKRRTKGNSTSYVAGGSTGSADDGSSNLGQDLLNSIQMGNLGTGAGVYGRRESNTFYFKSLVAGAGIAITSTTDSVIITATGGGSGGISSIETEDTPTVVLEGDGLALTPLTATVQISADADNALEARADGLYATAGGSVDLEFQDSESITIGWADVAETTIGAAVNISDLPGNALVINPDGLYAPAGEEGPEGPQGPQGLTGEAGPAGPAGEDGTSLQFKGAFDDVSELPGAAQEGDAYLVDGHAYVWTNGAFVDGGNLTGPTGPQGPIGLTGVKGDTGETGVAPNVKGTLNSTLDLPTDAVDGDAYFIAGHIWVQIDGNFEDMGSLLGPQGPAGTQGPQGLTGPQGPAGAAGTPGTAGVDGIDGNGIESAIIDGNGHLQITTTDGPVIDAGAVGHTKLVQLDDVTAAPGASDDGKAVVWNNATAKFVLGAAQGAVTTDTSTIDFSGSGSAALPLTAAVKRSATAGNTIVANADGIYSNKLLVVQQSGTNVSADAIRLNFTGAGVTVSEVAGTTNITIAGGGSGGTGGSGTIEISVDGTGKFVSATLPSGWTQISLSNLTASFKAPAGSRANVVQGWGLGTSTTSWQPFTFSTQAKLEVNAADETIITLTLSNLTVAQSANNGKVRLNIVT